MDSRSNGIHPGSSLGTPFGPSVLTVRRGEVNRGKAGYGEVRLGVSRRGSVSRIKKVGAITPLLFFIGM